MATEMAKPEISPEGRGEANEQTKLLVRRLNKAGTYILTHLITATDGTCIR